MHVIIGFIFMSAITITVLLVMGMGLLQSSWGLATSWFTYQDQEINRFEGRIKRIDDLPVTAVNLVQLNWKNTGGAYDARVGIEVGDRVFLLVFEGFECAGAGEISAPDLGDTDFYMSMHPSDWEEMLVNIRLNGGADLDHTLNTLDLSSDGGLAKSWKGDQYGQDLFFRYNQTFQYYYDASSEVETEFSIGVSPGATNE